MIKRFLPQKTHLFGKNKNLRRTHWHQKKNNKVNKNEKLSKIFILSPKKQNACGVRTGFNKTIIVKTRILIQKRI